MSKKPAEQLRSVLVELLTEELPPKSLGQLGKAFSDEVANGLIRYQLKQGATDWRGFATPRRLAVLIPSVLAVAEDRSTEITGPSIKAPPEAVAGFAKKQGVDVKDLKHRETPKGTVYLARVNLRGAALKDVLASVVSEALRKLPIPKSMRWGNGEAQFVRPVHGLVMMHGAEVVPGEVLNLKSGRKTVGHRFLSKGSIAIGHAESYEATLRNKGKVIASFAERREHIKKELLNAAASKQAVVFPSSDWPAQGSDDSDGVFRRMQIAQVIRKNNFDLLDEVTAIVEWPKVYMGQFEVEFLQIPPECISLTMQKNQKYFALTTHLGKLSESYLLVSNIDVRNSTALIEGNSRVLRARLSDAKFFFEQDQKTSLASRVPQLATVIFHSKLGTQLERVERIQRIATHIVAQVRLKSETITHVGRRAGHFLKDLWLAPNVPKHVERAAYLCKADLLTGMVGEFPELQGFVGAHYAEHDNEDSEVVAAIEGHYRPRFSGDNIFLTPVGTSVALADKLYTLAGLFGAGEQPTGDKDPFALRRAAIGVIRILIENQLPILANELVRLAFEQVSKKLGAAHTDLNIFLLDRLRVWLRDQGHQANQIEAVLALNPARFDLIPRQLEAVRSFLTLPEAESLAAANKRVANILKQAAAKGESFSNVEFSDLTEPAELALLNALRSASESAKPLLDEGDYTGYLKAFAVLKAPVDKFFDSVMVMVEDSNIRRNRLALLTDLRTEMNRVADISKLAA